MPVGRQAGPLGARTAARKHLAQRRGSPCRPQHRPPTHGRCSRAAACAQLLCQAYMPCKPVLGAPAALRCPPACSPAICWLSPIPKSCLLTCCKQLLPPLAGQQPGLLLCCLSSWLLVIPCKPAGWGFVTCLPTLLQAASLKPPARKTSNLLLFAFGRTRTCMTHDARQQLGLVLCFPGYLAAGSDALPQGSNPVLSPFLATSHTPAHLAAGGHSHPLQGSSLASSQASSAFMEPLSGSAVSRQGPWEGAQLSGLMQSSGSSQDLVVGSMGQDSGPLQLMAASDGSPQSVNSFAPGQVG